MPAQIRSAYPVFPETFTPSELQRYYTLSDNDRQLIQANARGGPQVLAFAALLKTCQQLGYFPALEDMPEKIVSHLRSQLLEQLSDDASENGLSLSSRSLYTYHGLIRDHLGIKAFSLEAAEPLLRRRLTEAAQTMNWVADLINVAIEVLIKENYELPAYSTLERLAGNVRATGHNEIFQAVDSRLTVELRASLRELLTPARGRGDKTTAWTRLKELPKRATLGHLRDLETHLDWLLSLGEVEKPLTGVSPAKIKDFAAEARNLSPKEMRDLTLLKRQAFVLCLVQQARMATRDHLVQMLIKRMAAIEAKAQAALDEARYQHRRTTERLVTVLQDMLSHIQGDDPAKINAQLQRIIKAQGGREQLRADCEIVLALRDDNYLPFMGRYFKPQRSALFRLLHLLDVRTTSQDRSITAAIAFVVKHEENGALALPATLDLAWASELWRRFIEVTADGHLQHKKLALEMCVFNQLVAELKTGDLAVNGSELFADFREQLLTWRQCQSRLDDYCDVSSLPRTAEGFVADRRLVEAPLKVGQDGEPVLPRLPALQPSRSFRLKQSRGPLTILGSGGRPRPSCGLLSGVQSWWHG